MSLIKTGLAGKPLAILGAVITALSLQGCANTVKYGEASRSETIKTEVGMNELQFATQKLASKMLAFPSVVEATATKQPTIAIDSITNHTYENLNTAPMTASLFARLTSSGKFRVSDQGQVKASHEQVKDLLDYGATTEKAAQFIGKETGADYVVYGSLANIIRNKPANKEVYYRITLNLFDTGTGKLIWKDEQDILKSQRPAIYGI